MANLHMNYGDLLIVDPCYIKNISTRWNGFVENRFDGLKCIKTLHEGDDGCYQISVNGDIKELGVDSGRVWVLHAEFGVDVELEDGFSGHILIPKGEFQLDDIKLLEV